jgi:hypothetical protein
MVRTARLLFAALLVAIETLSGCATFAPPQPWEKGDLAKPSMRFDADALATKATLHVYQSKEGASAGGSVGGGGCGCN